MKKLIIPLAAIIGAITLSACQSTDSSPSPDTAATTCTLNAYGQSVNSLGQPCATTTGTCAAMGYTYNPTTGQYVNQYGQPVACSTTGVGTTSVGSGLGGCTYWDSVYPGSNYIPMVDPTTGNLVCINTASYGISSSMLSSYGYNPYSSPVYASSCPWNQYNDPNWYYDCQSGNGWSYSGSTYGYSGGSGVCIGVGDGDGSDYGYGDSYFGICL